MTDHWPSAAPRSAPSPIICIGAVHLDHIAHADRPIRKETSTPARLVQKPGGVATNIARALAALGQPVVLAGFVGDDTAGKILTAQLRAEGLGLALVERIGQATGQYLALHDPDGSLPAACVDDRILAEAPTEEIDRLGTLLATDRAHDCRWFLDANLPAPALERLVARDPARWLAFDAVSVAKAERLRPFLPAADLIFANRQEATVLTGLDRDAPQARLAADLVALGTGAAVVTDGAAPVAVSSAGEGVAMIVPPVIEIRDVTGAGDALIAGTLAALCRGYDLTAAVRNGVLAAGLALGETGAVPETLTWDAISGQE